MNGKKAKALRRNLDVTTQLSDYVVKPQRKGVTAMLEPGHARAGYQAAKRMYNNRATMNALFGRVK